MSTNRYNKNANEQSTRRAAKLSIKEKLSIGTGGLTLSLGNQSVRTTGQGVLNMILGINAFWVGFVLAIPLLWDAITDPIIGNISDNFKSKFGRRRPFIFTGAILMGLSFASIWMIPMGWSDGGKLAWFLISSLIFYTSYTIFSVPYIALTYEMTSCYDERTAVQGYVTFWNRLGEMTYMGLIPLSLSFIAWKYGYADTNDLTNNEKLEGIRISAAIYGGIGMTLFGLFPAFFAKEGEDNRAVKAKKIKNPLWSSAKLTLQNRAFAILCLLAVFTIIAGVFAANMDWYLLIFHLSDGDITLGTQWKLIVTIGYAIVGILGIPLILWITSKISKINSLMLIYCMMIFNAVIRWFVYKPGRFDAPLTWTSIENCFHSFILIGKSLIWLDPLTGGVFWIGIGVLGQSMIADVCDDDELKHGQRREGMFGAIYGWSMKASFAVSFVLIGIFLEAIGFDPQWGSTRSLEVEAASKNYPKASANFSVIDDESNPIWFGNSNHGSTSEIDISGSVKLIVNHKSLSESDGQFIATLVRNDNSEEALLVQLKSDKDFLLQTPKSAIIPAGQKSMEIPIKIINDTQARGQQNVMITAWSRGSKPERASIKIIDNDGDSLDINISQDEIYEREGQIVAEVIRYTSKIHAEEVQIKILSKVPGKDRDAQAVSSITIPAGKDRIDFIINAVDNDYVDGQQSEETFVRMRLAMCFGAACPAFICLLLLRIYPLTKQKSEDNSSRLEVLRLNS